ncbi:MAG: hypothetical protein FWC01_07385 [Treponema sp.]|nr:hypothetical protein [Treponema sp.]MCL2237658.1 hypothetical protein [Treponema sp.]
MELKKSGLITCTVSCRNIIILTVLSITAALMNIFISGFVMNFLKFPLFLDTVFTAAIAFAFGIIPGIFTAVLSWFLPCFFYNGFSFYFLCSIAEVLLICALKPSAPDIPNFASKEKIAASYTALVSKLFLLYVLCAVIISLIGGVVDYITHLFIERNYYSVDDLFKQGLFMSNIPVFAINILSRIPINIVDRFIVIFAGFFISRGLVKIIK